MTNRFKAIIFLFVLLLGGFWYLLEYYPRALSTDKVSQSLGLEESKTIVIENKKDNQRPEVKVVDRPSFDLELKGLEQKVITRKVYPEEVVMSKIKNKGCVADGILTGYGRDEEENIAMINRSECEYLHRAVETWLEPPDFEEVREKVKKINEEPVLGMFIAEAIDKKADYYYPGDDRKFDFSKMCRKSSDNFWGEHTCKPTLEKKEYRRYVEHITQEAIDSGVQVFLFGQVFYQDSSDLDDSRIPETIDKIRAYADFRGVEVVIGAQTNDIDDEKYLKNFDFIEGGVGLKADGTIEEGPCFSRWYKKEGDWCWALLWHNRFKNQSSNVIVHLDWSGRVGDDMSVFALMSKKERENTLKYLYDYFQKRDVGFLMPMLAVLHKENGGCHGASRKFYSASREFSCSDEEAINNIFKK